MRVLLINLLLLALPAMLYYAYVWAARRDGRQGEIKAAPLLWLFAAGLLLMVAGIASFIGQDSGKPGQKYYPAYIKDGVVMPPRVE